MKKLLALFVAVVAATCVTASVAVASPGNGVATAQFTATYGSFTCKGQRIVTSGTMRRCGIGKRATSSPVDSPREGMTSARSPTSRASTSAGIATTSSS